MLPPPITVPTGLLIENQVNPTELKTTNPAFSAVYNTADTLRATDTQIRIATDSEFTQIISTSEDINLSENIVMAYNFDNGLFPNETQS